ncbi:hypothetical protein SAMN04490244_105110 [Tranquillimonas rosea]|uniref:Anti-sigma factor NepR domain-containing protein n=1 Tax=Tranquillimonas rosea TaxID=641238 RepID=A0A1H9U8L2_9RHOB|nr:hypothetical protein SAMN04490244_105110 [Tranquillimonas rosea]
MGERQKTSSAMRQIDENLKRVYKDVEEGEIPDRFKDLLDRLKEQDSNEK